MDKATYFSPQWYIVANVKICPCERFSQATPQITQTIRIALQTLTPVLCLWWLLSFVLSLWLALDHSSLHVYWILFRLFTIFVFCPVYSGLLSSDYLTFSLPHISEYCLKLSLVCNTGFNTAQKKLNLHLSGMIRTIWKWFLLRLHKLRLVPCFCKSYTDLQVFTFCWTFPHFLVLKPGMDLNMQWLYRIAHNSDLISIRGYSQLWLCSLNNSGANKSAIKSDKICSIEFIVCVMWPRYRFNVAFMHATTIQESKDIILTVFSGWERWGISHSNTSQSWPFVSSYKQKDVAKAFLSVCYGAS